MRFLSWAKCLMCTVFMCASMKYQEADGIRTTPHPKDCIYKDSDGKIYNLTTLRNSNGTPRFEASRFMKSAYPGYPDQEFMYSFNPCISFTLGPSGEDDDCQTDVAICLWNQRDIVRIGNQSSVQFGFYKQTKIPALHYSSGPFWKSTVLLKCDLNEEEGTFRVWKDWKNYDVVLNLTHKCACPNACLMKLSEPTAVPSDPTDNILVEIVAFSFAGAGLFTVLVIIAVIFRRKLIVACRTVFRRQPNDERRAILGENRGAEIDIEYNIPPIASGGSELAPGGGSSCSEITVPNKKDDLNNKFKMRNVSMRQ